MAQTPEHIPVDIQVAIAPIKVAFATLGVVGDVMAEITSAREKHGLQHDLPLGFGEPLGNMLADVAAAVRRENPDRREAPLLVYSDNEDLERYAKAACEDGSPTWAKVTFEEFAEALGADGPEEARAELIQLAAMAICSVVALDAQQA